VFVLVEKQPFCNYVCISLSRIAPFNRP